MPENAQKPRKNLEKPKKYITERIKVEKLIPGGQALGTLESGKKIFLWNALPGELVADIEITKSKSSFEEGIAETILAPSPDRIAPEDACYLSTSPWQIIRYETELEQKRALVIELLRQHQIELPKDVAVASVQTDGQDFYYRNKMEYSLYFDHTDEKIHLAFRARGSHRKVPIAQSSLERPEILQEAQSTDDRLNAEHAEARRFQSLLLRASQDGTVSGGLFENHRPHPRFPNLHDTILGHEYSYSPNGFFQINLPVYELALREIAQHVQTARVLDLYAGVGTIGLSVARDHQLTLVECDKSAYRELEANCNGTSAQPVYTRSEEALEYIAPDQTVILDPPRAGCRPELLGKLLDVTPPTIIYLSCNPATQARDVKILLEKYRIRSVTPFNFFPRTPHIENLIILERIKNAA